MVTSALSASVLADMKARLSGWVATGQVSVDDINDLLTFLSIHLEGWVRRGGR